MARNIQIMSSQPALGGTSDRLAATTRSNTYRADLSTPFPSGSIFKPSNTLDALADVSPTLAVAQATIDFLKVLFAIALVAVTGVGLGLSIFYFLFL
ncbi:hypothetical protein [Bradyrhizobium phage ppBeUSDA76-2]|uniref:hypothetical protein n=2 Tax=Bradyrhizobium TaxID=374 RepID=UPI0011435A41|nr:hypothetical protein [Bradyrhizobium elkanii]WAX24399.1 hypothetical protein [Bradyrhizobium phage ppBeUSDA76-2]MCP1732446.1 hypothetical protein [Bradyrhizobium elkanii]MCS3567784.1 hypothetical protein [Bradyrhizobium elkanii]MCS3590733.1 hypothetical protein [Bradyrhizobium elkanii]MCS3620176.1 hypothetical protein [Bradyrhizobium elkanii]